MKTKRPNKSIPLSDFEEEKLTVLAATHGCYSKTGPTAGMPSWRRFVSDLAAGEFVIRRRAGSVAPPAPPAPVVPDPVPPVVSDVAAPTGDRSLPLWWPREEDGSMKAYADVDGAMAAECKAMGLALTEWGYEARDEWLAEGENVQSEGSPPSRLENKQERNGDSLH